MNKKILFVEDEDQVREAIEMILSSSGYDYKSCSTGKNVLQLISEYQPDLILLDIMLPDVDGRELCKQIKNNDNTASIPVIVVSGLPEIYNTIADVGANDIVLKPFDESTLLRRIERQFTQLAN